MPKLPCHIISVDVEDAIGSHVQDIEGTLKKNVIDSRGNIIEVIDPKARAHDPMEVMAKTLEDIDNQKGCKLKGTLIVNKINGNFHISSHSYAEAVMLVVQKNKLLDFEHKINHLSFGDEDHISKIKQLTGGYNLSPLDKIGESIHPSNHGGHLHHTYTTYYLDIMKTRYFVGADEEYSAHEYTYSMQTINTHSFPAIFVKFELSPLFISYRVTENPFIIFFIRCWAIIGGVNTIAGIIKILRSDSSKQSKKKNEQGGDNVGDSSVDSLHS